MSDSKIVKDQQFNKKRFLDLYIPPLIPLKLELPCGLLGLAKYDYQTLFEIFHITKGLKGKAVIINLLLLSQEFFLLVKHPEFQWASENIHFFFLPNANFTLAPFGAKRIFPRWSVLRESRRTCLLDRIFGGRELVEISLVFEGGGVEGEGYFSDGFEDFGYGICDARYRCQDFERGEIGDGPGVGYFAEGHFNFSCCLFRAEPSLAKWSYVSNYVMGIVLDMERRLCFFFRNGVQQRIVVRDIPPVVRFGVTCGHDGGAFRVVALRTGNRVRDSRRTEQKGQKEMLWIEGEDEFWAAEVKRCQATAATHCLEEEAYQPSIEHKKRKFREGPTKMVIREKGEPEDSEDDDGSTPSQCGECISDEDEEIERRKHHGGQYTRLIGLITPNSDVRNFCPFNRNQDGEDITDYRL